MKYKKGFTLVELLLSLTIASILILSSAVVMLGGNAMWERGLQRANLQRDASFAMTKITRAIREGNNAVLEDNGNIIKITNSSNWVKYYRDSSTKKLMLEVQDEIPVAIIDDNIIKLQFQQQPKLISVTLSLEEDDYTVEYTSTVMMRNLEG
jgi:prepilin-type N-terminal cleavage/methylation domain-containing protein